MAERPGADAGGDGWAAAGRTVGGLGWLAGHRRLGAEQLADLGKVGGDGLRLLGQFVDVAPGGGLVPLDLVPGVGQYLVCLGLGLGDDLVGVFLGVGHQLPGVLAGLAPGPLGLGPLLLTAF
jgi:hypothetical protein